MDYSGDFRSDYFIACQNETILDLENVLRNDCKNIKFYSIGPKIMFGQLLLWDTQEISSFESIILHKIRTLKIELVNVIDIKTSKSYIWADDKSILAWVGTLVDGEIVGNCFVAPKMWLRKELIKIDMERVN